MDSTVGAFEAKAQLSGLLRAVERGERFTITVRGKPVADLIPHRDPRQAEMAAAVAALRAFPRIQGVSEVELASWKQEGRR